MTGLTSKTRSFILATFHWLIQSTA